MDLYDEIYFSLTGQLAAEDALLWVPNAFSPGTSCEAAYFRLIAARDRLLERLGQGEDPDLEQMLSEMETIQHTLCREVLALRLPCTPDQTFGQ